jgi:hypothetical protein
VKDFIKQHHVALLICVAVIIAHTAVFLWVKDFYQGYGQAFPTHEHFFDSGEYVDLANSIWNRHAFTFSTTSPYIPESFRVPGYPLLIALVHEMFGGGDSFDAVIYLQILITALSVFLTYLLGMKVSGSKWVGYLAAFLFGFNPNTITFTIGLNSEPLFILIFLLSIYVSLSMFFKEKTRFALSGLLLGASVLVRCIATYVPLCFGVYLLFAREFTVKKKLFLFGIFLLCFVIVLTPWIVRNKVVTGVWGISSTTAYNFYYGYVPLFEKYKQASMGQPVTEAVFEIPFDPWNRGLEIAPQLQRKSLEVIAAEPVAYAQYHLSKLSPFLEQSSIETFWWFFQTLYKTDHTKAEYALIERSLIWPEVTETLILEFLAGLAFISIFFIRRKEIYFFFWANILWFYVGTGPVASFSTRYRNPIEPLLFILAMTSLVFGARYLYRAIKNPRMEYARFRKFVSVVAGKIESFLIVSKNKRA